MNILLQYSPRCRNGSTDDLTAWVGSRAVGRKHFGHVQAKYLFLLSYIYQLNGLGTF